MALVDIHVSALLQIVEWLLVLFAASQLSVGTMAIHVAGKRQSFASASSQVVLRGVLVCVASCFPCDLLDSSVVHQHAADRSFVFFVVG